MRIITKHCIKRISERYLLDINFRELNNIIKLIKTGFYIIIKEENDKLHLLTRYKNKYIKLIMLKDKTTLITALPINENDLEYVEKFIKEFNI